MPKQLINIIGAIVIVAILAMGILLVGMPMYVQALATGVQSAQVAQSNDAYQTQVDELKTQQERFDEITADVAALQSQIPSTTRNDDVFEIVAKAAAAAGVTVVSVSAGEPAAWTPRTGQPADAAQDTTPSTDGAAPTPAPSPDATTDSTTGGATDPQSAPPSSPQVQVPISISVSAPDTARAAAFIDQLGMGPRLLGIESSILTEADGSFTLDVEALSFVRTDS
jgi:hypothetical protein